MPDAADYQDITSVRGLLVAARQLISDPRKWTKHAWARDARGEPCAPGDEAATCFCARGAIYYIDAQINLPPVLVDKAVGELNEGTRQTSPFSQVTSLNDVRATTHEMVLEVFDRRIRELDT